MGHSEAKISSKRSKSKKKNSHDSSIEAKSDLRNNKEQMETLLRCIGYGEEIETALIDTATKLRTKCLGNFLNTRIFRLCHNKSCNIYFLSTIF